jgi:hypothetical protein
MTWVVAVVAVAVVRVKNASTLVMGRKTEVFVEEVGELHGMVDVRWAAGAVGRSAEAGVGAVRLRVSGREWGRKQGGSNWLLQACAKRREKFRKDKLASSDDLPGE